MISQDIGIRNFLTSTQKQTLSTLYDKPLKTLICTYLSSIDTIEIARVALDILAKSGSCKERNQFVAKLLKGDSHSAILDQLQRVAAISQSELFKDFLSSIETTEVEDLVDRTIPCLQQNDQVDAKFLEIMSCQNYHKLTTLLRNYVDSAVRNKDFFSEILEKIFDIVDDDSICSYENPEKILLVKIAASLIGYHDGNLCRAEKQIQTLFSLAASINDDIGPEVLRYLCRSFLSAIPFRGMDEIFAAMHLILSASKKKKAFYQALSEWKAANFDWDQLHLKFVIAAEQENQPYDSFEQELDNILDRFKNDPIVKNPLSDIHIQLLREQYRLVEQFCFEFKSMDFSELISIAHTIRERAYNNLLEQNDRYKLIAIGRLAIKYHFRIYPYTTQILALLGVFLENKSWQAQVKTGEGKSTIITIWAFVGAMECHSVDLITSARYLSIRDQKKYKQFFKDFGIITSHICYDNQKPEHFKADVIYAPAFDFEFGFMKDLLFNRQLYAARLTLPYMKANFDWVGVDESDNLLIDTASNSARLSSPAEVSYAWVYAPILTYVKNEIVSQPLSEKTKKQHRAAIRQVLAANGNEEKAALISDRQIKTWISSACIALTKKKANIDYVIREICDESGIKKKKIQIVDPGTGRISLNSRWNGGVHEFLEIIHDRSADNESIMPISLSHSVFYKYYRNVTAFTGTAEKHQTKEIYGIDTFDVPPHLPLKRVDYPTIIIRGKENHFQCLLFHINKLRAEGRPILCHSKTIEGTINLSKRLNQGNVPNALLNELQEENEEQIIAEAGFPGKVTIATNTAGRGTDIILSQESLKNGGLHVLGTNFFDTEREYLQFVGRAGRQGQPGSSQMILCYESEVEQLFGEKASLFASMTDELLLLFLEQRRKVEEQRTAQTHFRLAELERHLATKTEMFFKAYRQWSDTVEQDQFIEFYSQIFYSIKLAPNKVLDCSHLSFLDRKLAESGKELMSCKAQQPLRWKMFLKEAILRLQNKIIAHWSLSFYQTITHQFFHNIDDVDAKKREIDAAFESHRKDWEKYFAADGTGILIYLQEILSVDFLTILRRLRKI